METTTDQRDYVIELLYDKLFDKMITRKDKWFDVNYVTLNNIIEHKKQVLICADVNIINRKKEELSQKKFAELKKINSKIGIW